MMFVAVNEYSFINWLNSGSMADIDDTSGKLSLK